VLIEVQQIEKSNGLILDNLIKSNDNCVTQVLPNLPNNAILRQACYLYFNSLYKARIRNPTIFFLLLLLPFEQIKDAIEYVRNTINSQEKVYLIKCCKNGNYNIDIIRESFLSNQDRFILTKNSLLSIGSL